MRLYRLRYESSPGRVTEWEKTADELLVPNGSEDTLLDWLLKEVEARGGQVFTLELMPVRTLADVAAEHPDSYEAAVVRAQMPDR